MRTFSELMHHATGDATMIGTWTQIAAPEVVDILGGCGFNFTIIDTQHAALSMQTVEQLVRACEAADLTPLVRVAANLPHLIVQALDLGAAAVMVPGISSAADAERAVAAARLGPHGERSACPLVRAGGHLVSDWPAFARRADTETGIIALVETAQGVAEAESIAAVPGVVALIAGPFDLAVAMGHGDDMTHPEVSGALERLAAAAQARGVPLIMPIFAAAAPDCLALMQQWRARGLSWFTIGSDKLFLADHVRRYVATMRAG